MQPRFSVRHVEINVFYEYSYLFSVLSRPGLVPRGADAPGRGDDAAAVRARHQAGGRPPAVPARPGGAAGIATTVLYYR